MKKVQALGIIIIILVLIAIASYFVLNTQKTPTSPKTNGIAKETGEVKVITETEQSQEETQETKENVVEITSSGFFPQSLTISQGKEITFINKDSGLSWPASAVHTEHRAYPGSDISKCNTSEKNKIFDACGGLKNGESYSFTFNEKGSWRYHDHLNPSSTGVIVVE
ncbi:MAG: hypothetical protein AABW90_01135 [Nanoarchaeota archaeon]